ncbi:MAG: YcaO-like family protein [Proteobacteria bacterium]|nr:YcaO-like family protein [Pseudomonadota bacterium]
MVISEETYRKIYNQLQGAGIIGRCEPYPYGVSSFFRYHCERKSNDPKIRRGYGFGSSVIETEAKFFAMAEAVERYCALNEKKEEYITGSYADLKPKAVNPLLFLSFTEKQLKSEDFERFRFDEDTVFNWIPAKSLFDNSEHLIPAQLVFAEYDCDIWQEPIIRFPTSTGAACGSTLENAILTGLREVIERDNYLINLWNGLSPSQINIFEIDSVKELLNEIKHKGIEVHCLDLSLDFIEARGYF